MSDWVKPVGISPGHIADLVRRSCPSNGGAVEAAYILPKVVQQAAAIERRRRETELAAWTWSLTDPRTEVGVTEAKGAARAQARLGTVEADAEALVLQVIDELSTADLYVERDGNGAISTVALL